MVQLLGTSASLLVTSALLVAHNLSAAMVQVLQQGSQGPLGVHVESGSLLHNFRSFPWNDVATPTKPLAVDLGRPQGHKEGRNTDIE